MPKGCAWPGRSAGVASAYDDARDMSDVDDACRPVDARVGDVWRGFRPGRAGDGVLITICGRPREGEEGGVGGWRQLVACTRCEDGPTPDLVRDSTSNGRLICCSGGEKLPRLPMLLMVLSKGGATRIFLSALRCPALLALARAYVDADESPQNEWERFGAPGRPVGVGDFGDEGGGYR